MLHGHEARIEKQIAFTILLLSLITSISACRQGIVNNTTNFPTLATTPANVSTQKPTTTPTITSTLSPSSTPALTPTIDKSIYPHTDPCWVDIEKQSAPAPAKNDGPLYVEAARTLFSKWLTEYVICVYPSYWRIDGYELQEIRLFHDGTPISIGIVFSIKPSQPYSWFAAGNGDYDPKTGWITGKYIHYDILITNNEFHLVHPSTAP